MPAQWRTLVDHVMSVPEQIYESWNARDGWDNDTRFGRQFGQNRVPWCVIYNVDMYTDVGMSGIVPRVNNVTVFSSWAKKHGQWSEYPSIGAWVNLGNGAHTEIVVGFDANTVYTKGGNSVKEGSTDAGQGNGVWSHATPRRSARVVGYFAPRFKDGICPPTADPHDPRGGKAVTSWRWSPSSRPTQPPTSPKKPTTSKPSSPKRIPYPPGIRPNSNKPSAKDLQRMLKATGWLARSVPLADNYGPRTQAAVAGFNKKHRLSDSGKSYDPAIGPRGWKLLNELAYG